MNNPLSAFLVAALAASPLSGWVILDDFQNLPKNAADWQKTTGPSFDGLGNTGSFRTAYDPLNPGNNGVLAYVDGNAKGIYLPLGPDSIGIGETKTFYFEWFLPEGGNYNVGVGMSPLADPSNPTGTDYQNLMFRAAGDDSTPFLHFKVNTEVGTNRGIWEVTDVPFTEGTWWSYWIVLENLGGTSNSATYYAAPRGNAPGSPLWTEAYLPGLSIPFESVLLIGGGGGTNTDVSYYDLFALADGEDLTTPTQSALIPEPSVLGLLGLGSIVLLLIQRRR